MLRLVFLRLLVVLMILVGAIQLIKASAATSFTFSAVGDFGYTNNTKAVLKALGTSGVDFHLAIGDLNYDYPRVSAQQWSGYVTGAIGQTVPFEIVAGEHDTADITQLETLLPDRIGTITGTYGEQYFFDYPPAAPLARFILASPGVLGAYAYKKGQADYNWVATAIDDARQKHIPWVIVGIHKYCFAISAMVCTAPDLMNLLVSKKVDLILQGQLHGYQASKQLALDPQTCPKLSTKPRTYNGNCVVNTPTPNAFSKGQGTIIVISGTGGKSLSPDDPTDPESGYFRTWMAGNSNPTWGFSQFTVSPTQISMHFHGAAGGNFSDNFTIS